MRRSRLPRGSVLYLFQERELKTKKPHKFYYRLPPLAAGRSHFQDHGLGFVLITLRHRRQHVGLHRIETAWIRQPRSHISFFTWASILALYACEWPRVRGRKAAYEPGAGGLRRPHLGRHARLGALLLKP